jgi:hypothetical protein
LNASSKSEDTIKFLGMSDICLRVFVKDAENDKSISEDARKHAVGC